MLSRREFFLASTALVAFRNDTLNVVEKLLASSDAHPQDEDFWAQIQQAFSLDRNVVNFNNGGCSPSPRIVQDALRRQIEYSNQAPSYLMWQQLEPEVESVRRRLAAAFGCDAEEIAITRNASESLETVLLGFDFKPGDEVITTVLDYPRMITTLHQRERRDGIKLVQIAVPPIVGSTREYVRAIESAITDRTRLILASHVSFMNGQIFPVRAINDLGHKRGIPVLIDGAHAFAQFPMQRDELGVDFYGTSLHKWLMAPLGTGFLYVRKEKIKDVWSLMASGPEQVDNIRKFEEIGTHPAANHNAIGEALTFNEMIGFERKAARLRYLRSQWTEHIADCKNVRYYTSLDPHNSCGLTTVGIRGIKTADLQAYLLAKHNIYVTSINTPGTGTEPLIDGIRVTPNVYTTIAEVKRFAAAMREAATVGVN